MRRKKLAGYGNEIGRNIRKVMGQVGGGGGGGGIPKEFMQGTSIR